MIITPWSLFKYNCNCFDLKTAPSIFQKYISETLSKLEETLVCMHALLIFT